MIPGILGHLATARTFLGAFKGPCLILALVAALAGAVAGTWVTRAAMRSQVAEARQQLAEFRFLARTTALLAGTAGTWLTWPQAGKFAVLWGLVTGFCSPLVYTGGVRALGRFWPWLSNRASTDGIDDTDEAGA